MSELDGELERALVDLERRGLRRDLAAVDALTAEVDFASNDYLGLARDPRLGAAAREAIERDGIGGRAARLLGGGSALDLLESELAEWLDAEAALSFPSGYQANVGTISALCSRGDAVILDALAHASAIDGARLSRAHVLVHRHGDLADLERALRDARGARRRLVYTEGVFSVTGACVDLAGVEALCRRHDATLVVDEAHALGVVGKGGRGAAFDVGIATSCIRIATGGKSLGASGGFAIGSRVLRDWLANRARAFVFTTAPSPGLTAALRVAIPICRDADAERARVRELAAQLACSFDLREPAAAIVALPYAEPSAALAAQHELVDAGFDVRAVRPPTTPDGTSCLRVVVHAFNEVAEVERLVEHVPRSARAVGDAAPVRGRCTFVVGTDTGVGKTVASAILLRAALDRGEASYWKPVQTGDESDTECVAELAGVPVADLEQPVWELPLPASPHEAAREAGVSIELDPIDRRLEELRGDRRLVIELAGGLMVPYGDGHLQIDWLARRATRMVLVARSGLGTLNHTLLSLEALRRRGLVPELLFLVGPRHRSNAATLRELSGVPIVEVPPLDPLNAAAVARFVADAGEEANDWA